ncbi:hypothetical protein GQ53DRAFT_518642 [Thozetella sp. PMI_491]|nr:hypothetical protein GQ53DRAFT_518642 [Thozetella sp. PMI_491]
MSACGIRMLPGASPMSFLPGGSEAWRRGRTSSDDMYVDQRKQCLILWALGNQPSAAVTDMAGARYGTHTDREAKWALLKRGQVAKKDFGGWRIVVVFVKRNAAANCKWSCGLAGGRGPYANAQSSSSKYSTSHLPPPPLSGQSGDLARAMEKRRPAAVAVAVLCRPNISSDLAAGLGGTAHVSVLQPSPVSTFRWPRQAIFVCLSGGACLPCAPKRAKAGSGKCGRHKC